MDKLLIIGNSGSGKTWLSEKLHSETGLHVFNMDEIFWQSGGYSEKRSIEEQDKIVDEIHNKDQWIVEGVFGELAEKFIQKAECLIFLDLPWDDCKNNLLKRNDNNSEQAVHTDISALLKWASKYNKRKTKTSKIFHNHLFDDFSGVKYKLTRGQDIGQFKINKKGLS